MLLLEDSLLKKLSMMSFWIRLSQNHKAHLDKLVEYCETGLKEGARLLLGGKRCDRKGLYMEPTIFCDVEDHMFIAKEESFGPIMVVTKFNAGDVEGVVKRANNSEYGLA